jgi:tetratricopeptide (TPR) repeat protein
LEEETVMKKLITMAIVLLFALPVTLIADDLPKLKADAAAASKAADAAKTYDTQWKAAKAWRDYGDDAVSHEAPGWKEIAKVAGKEGMKYGELAQKSNPNGIEGWYYYGLSVGTYSDGVSILTALAEGLKGKTQKSFETAYKLNKKFDNCGPILSLGRFWQVLPGIAGRDRKKAEQLFNEYVSIMGNSKDCNNDVWFFRGELYKDLGKKAEAKADLTKAAAGGNKDAKKLLEEMK